MYSYSLSITIFPSESNNGVIPLKPVPREIYISNVKRTDVSKLKTVLRYKVSNKKDYMLP